MSRIAASLPDGVFWGTQGISRVSSRSERRRMCDAYFRIRVTGEFEGSMVQVHSRRPWQSGSRAVDESSCGLWGRVRDGVRNEKPRSMATGSKEGPGDRREGKEMQYWKYLFSQNDNQVFKSPQTRVSLLFIFRKLLLLFSSIYLAAPWPSPSPSPSPSPLPLLPCYHPWPWPVICSSMSTPMSICPATPPFFDSE
jgi:hypothetical protein